MLKKDLLELCLLSLLSQGDAYGYQLLRRVAHSFPGTQESSVYAVLRTLCRAGHTQQYEGTASCGPTRKYYRITGAGRERLEALLDQWRRLRDGVASLGVC